MQHQKKPQVTGRSQFKTEIPAHHYYYNLTACSAALRGAEPAAPDHTDSSDLSQINHSSTFKYQLLN